MTGLVFIRVNMSNSAVIISFEMYTSIFQGNTEITLHYYRTRYKSESQRVCPIFFTLFVVFFFFGSREEKITPASPWVVCRHKSDSKKAFYSNSQNDRYLSLYTLYARIHIKLQTINKNKGTIDHVFGTVSNFSRPLAHVCNVARREI